MRRIGIFGGTFNPIHNGHLLIAENAYDQYDLDIVIFVPTGQTWYKEGADRSKDEHRKNMVKLAIQDNPAFDVSFVEIDSGGYSYTSKTLQYFKKEYPDDELYFIMGADSLSYVEKWRDPQIIFDSAIILTAVRDDYDAEELEEEFKELEATYHGRFGMLRTPEFDVSSNDLRTRLSEGRTVRYLIPDAVRDYIKENGLYKN